VAIQIAAFVNQNNLKNATAFFMKAGNAKAALNKEYHFLLFALVSLNKYVRNQYLGNYLNNFICKKSI